MISPAEQEKRLTAILEDIDLPDTAYEAAHRRYKDLGAWIERPDSTLAGNDPHVFVQGSFAFGTAIRPLLATDEYDLDFSCKLRAGYDRTTHSQSDLRQAVGLELEDYRLARNIKDDLIPKHRCWRLQYQDELKFHMDIVPSIPADYGKRRELAVLMETAGIRRPLAEAISENAVWITDDRSDNFEAIDQGWPASNPEGYLQWFLQRTPSEGRSYLVEAKVDPVPVYRSRSPLQQAVQILKRHRDVMFKDLPDAKPISIIITTIVGQAYVPGESLAQTIHRVLISFDAVRITDSDEILNPVNPAENFADRWTRHDCLHLRLKDNFHRWVHRAVRDFGFLTEDADPRRAITVASDGFQVRIPEATFGLTGNPLPEPRQVTLAAEPAAPWTK